MQGPRRIQWLYLNQPSRSWFQLLVGAMFLGLLLFFGIWLLMIAATVAVLLLPYFYWKKRKLIQRMQQYQQQYQQQYHSQQTASESTTSHSGVVIEGEVIERGKDS